MYIIKASKKDYKLAKKIYCEAFPIKERKPWFIMTRKFKNNHTSLWCLKDENTLLSILTSTNYKDMVYYDYFATSSKARGKGLGSELLNAVVEQNNDKRNVLILEKIDPKYDNNDIRIRRKKYYLKNGFNETNIFISMVSGEYEVLIRNGEITDKEFVLLMRHSLGETIFKLSKLKVIN